MRIYRIKLGMLYNLSNQASSMTIHLNALGCKLIVCWDLKEHHIMIIIITNHKGKISIGFSVSANLETSYFKTTATITRCDLSPRFFCTDATLLCEFESDKI